jgi:hypothetical protein
LRCGPPALPPPLGSSFPWWRRDRVCLPPLGSGRGGVDVLLAPRRAALALRCGRPLTPPPRALVDPLALILRSIAADTASMARASHLVAAIAKEEWQWWRRWPTRRQMASVMRRGRPLAPPPRSSFPWRPDHIRSPLLLMRSGRAVSLNQCPKAVLF